MAVQKVATGWQVDVRPEGRVGRRVRKIFLTKGEAQRFESFVKAEAAKGKPWNPEPTDARALSELVNIWYELHGRHLKDGEARKRKLDAVVAALEKPRAQSLRAEDFLRYRDKRSKSGIHAKTLNNELGYLCAVFNELRRTQQISYENPLQSVRAIKLSERELSFLTPEQIKELLSVMEKTSDNPHVLLITKISLSTGCRWGEAEKMHIRQVGAGRLTFVDTKSGRNRTVPISDDLEREIREHEKKHGSNGKLFTSSMGAFRRALAKTSIELPKGQAAHVLRHTFASHFVMNGGDILTLQKILGHSSVVMTMRYSHLAPEHLEKAKALNPIYSTNAY